MRDKIYVHIIEGSEDWIPINAERTNGYHYIILEDNEYADIDPSLLFEFYPGDVVEVEPTLEEEYEFKALNLISFSNHPDRKYLYFKYKGTRRLLPTNKDIAEEFKEEICRIKNEISAGQFVYRGIKETIKYLDINTGRESSG